MQLTKKLLEQVVREVMDDLQLESSDPRRVVIGVSNRHVHLSSADFRTLFGYDEPTVRKLVRQRDEYAADETVTVQGPRNAMEKVRVMGPLRARSQVELSHTDCYALGLKAPVRQSGHLDDAAPVTLVGPRGSVNLDHAAIIASRHVHLGPQDAKRLGVQDQDLVKVAFEGDRGGVLDNVICRVKDNFTSEIHIDTDEANAIGARTGDVVTIITGQV